MLPRGRCEIYTDADMPILQYIHVRKRAFLPLEHNAKEAPLEHEKQREKKVI